MAKGCQVDISRACGEYAACKVIEPANVTDPTPVPNVLVPVTKMLPFILKAPVPKSSVLCVVTAE